MTEKHEQLSGVEVDEKGNMNMFGYSKVVQVKLSKEGFHRWKEAPDEVAHLRNYHRHIFYMKFQIGIEADRGVEYYLFQEKIKEITERYMSRQVDFTDHFDWEEFYELTGQGLEEDVLVINSCEHFAEWLVSQLEQEYGTDRHISCMISEDDENGSIVTNFY